VAEHGEELILGQIRAGLFLQLYVRLLQFFLAVLELDGERLRLLKSPCGYLMWDDADSWRLRNA
jgi:hypothetical protein